MVTHKNKYKSFLLMILSFLVIILPACGEKDGSGYLFRYSLLGNPKNLDPQLAVDTSSLVVIQNMFCGLLRTTSTGKLTEGVAKLPTISSDSLKYTFVLSKDFYWAGSDSDYKVQVTANDFVFAFKRIFDESTKSPYMKTFSCIKNAEKIISGELDENSIGVTATGDFQLEFELDYPNANFLSLLTTSPAMPCNEEFFTNAKGKYGLDSEAAISDGAFYLKQWEYDPYGSNNYIIMRKNKFYSANDTVYPSSLNFFIEEDSDKILSDFTTNSTDCIISDGQNENILKGSYTVNEFETISTGLVFNLNSEIFSNINFRQALSLAVDRSEYEDRLSDSARPAYAIVPSGVTMLNKSYRDLISENDKSQYNITQAKEKWSQGLTSLGKITIDSIKILVPESFSNSDWLKFITQQWQNKLEFFCGIEIVSDGDYESRISSGDYQIALYQLSCTYNNPEAIFSNFITGSQNNKLNYSNAAFDEIIKKSSKVQNLNECVEYYSEAEKMVIDDYVYTPLFYQKEFLVYNEKIADIEYNPFTKQIDFRKAKNYD